MKGAQKNVCRSIEEYARLLKLPSLRSSASTVLEDAILKDPGYDQFLLRILQQEYDRQQENGRKNRIRAAGFPCERYLEDLVQDALPPEARQKASPCSKPLSLSVPVAM